LPEVTDDGKSTGSGAASARAAALNLDGGVTAWPQSRADRRDLP